MCDFPKSGLKTKLKKIGQISKRLYIFVTFLIKINYLFNAKKTDLFMNLSL